jgi:hypothetical protein
MYNLRNHLWQLIKRSAPYAIFNWRYLSLNQSPSVRLHRLVFLQAWPDLPRAGWWVIALYSYAVWFGFQGWIRLWKTWKKFSPILMEHSGISRSKQFLDLWRLVFLQTTPPIYYYRYRLYRYTSREWMDFIYTYELPAWHRVMSPNLSQRSATLLSDKAAFAQEMRQQGLPVIDGMIIPQGSCVTKEQLFQQSSIFLKPLFGSRKIDAYRLEYHELSDTYTLVVSADEVIDDPERIIAFVQVLAEKHDYIIQPLLNNHPGLQVLSSFEVLITIRMITVWTGSKSQAVSAVIELPADAYSNRVYLLPVDIQSGVIIPVEETVFSVLNDTAFILENLTGHKVVHWEELVDISQKAHAYFSDIFSVGWDLAVTPDGVRLIEGNFNWAVDPHQINKPLLMPSHILYAWQDIVKNSKTQKI